MSLENRSTTQVKNEMGGKTELSAFRQALGVLGRAMRLVRTVFWLSILAAVVLMFSLVWAHWPMALAGRVLSATGFVAEGFSGSLKEGLHVGHYRDESDIKLIDVRDLDFKFGVAGFPQKKPILVIERLVIKSIRYEERFLERPRVAEVREKLEAALGSIATLRLKGTNQPEVQIRELEIGELIYRPSLHDEGVHIGPIVMRNLMLDHEGFTLESFESHGNAEIKASRLPFVNSPFVLQAEIRIAPSFFTDAEAPFAFEARRP
jgi:hypothetical protein